MNFLLADIGSYVAFLETIFKATPQILPKINESKKINFKFLYLDMNSFVFILA